MKTILSLAILGWLAVGVLVQIKDFLWYWKRVQKHYVREVIGELFSVAFLAAVFPLLLMKNLDKEITKDNRFPERKDFE